MYAYSTVLSKLLIHWTYFNISNYYQMLKKKSLPTCSHHVTFYETVKYEIFYHIAINLLVPSL